MLSYFMEKKYEDVARQGRNITLRSLKSQLSGRKISMEVLQGKRKILRQGLEAVSYSGRISVEVLQV